MRRISIIVSLMCLGLAGCGTHVDLSYPTEHGPFEAHLADFKDREAFQASLVRDPATGMVTGLEVTSAQALTSPTAAANAAAIAALSGTVIDLAKVAAGVPPIGAERPEPPPLAR